MDDLFRVRHALLQTEKLINTRKRYSFAEIVHYEDVRHSREVKWKIKTQIFSGVLLQYLVDYLKEKREVMMKTIRVWVCIVAMVMPLCNMGSVFAAVMVAPLKMEQGKHLVAVIPQFESGMDANFLGEYNEAYRQLVMTEFGKFETVAFKTRESPQIPDHMKNGMTFHSDYEVFRNDPKFISLTQIVYQYTGGAHGNSRLTASTVHLQTGRAYKLMDLFADGVDFTGRLSEVVRQEGLARRLPLWGFKGVRPDSAFYLTEEGVVLFFQPYEIAPYSEGIIRILVSYRDLDDILQPEVGK